MTRNIGFSTGALAKGNFREGLKLQPDSCAAVELSALREHELEPLLAALDQLRIERYQYVSVHAPSKLIEHDEDWLIKKLRSFPAEWPIVVHPDLIREPSRWVEVGSRLCLENMDIARPRAERLTKWRVCSRCYPRPGSASTPGMRARSIPPWASVWSC
ncbi:MAG: hypothetical protein KY459_11885 [Acidobacteria bacterium]|nr:hypothetical protein [Acidobacteriota bacterium]